MIPTARLWHPSAHEKRSAFSGRAPSAALDDGFIKLGHEVMRGSRDGGKLADWKQKAGAKAKTGTFAETARFADVVVLAVKGTAPRPASRPARRTRRQDGARHHEPHRRNAAGRRRTSVLHRAQRIAHGALAEARAHGALREGLHGVGNSFMVNPRLGGQCRPCSSAATTEGARRSDGAPHGVRLGGRGHGSASPLAPSSRCACCGAFRGCRATAGITHSSC